MDMERMTKSVGLSEVSEKWGKAESKVYRKGVLVGEFVIGITTEIQRCSKAICV